MDGERPAAGDGRIVSPEDFEAAFVRYFPAVYRFIAARVGSAVAEDLAAETFATAYRRRASFEPGRGSLRSWLYGIAVNLVRSHWRAEQHLLLLDARLVPEVDLLLALAGLGIAAVGALGPASWAATSKTTTALRAE
jgi:DNA-directed RNA polymerase specialized sigma24 family protein